MGVSDGYKIHAVLHEGISGSLSGKEMAVLAIIAQLTSAKTIVEIGTYRGYTSLCLAANTPDTTAVHTIDLDPKQKESLRIPLRAENIALTINDTSIVGEAFRGSEYERTGRIIQHFSDSTQFDFSLIGPIDLAFIDGSHDYHYVAEDTKNILANIELDKGGIIAWHDYPIYGVYKVVDKLSKKDSTASYFIVEGTRICLRIPNAVVPEILRQTN